MTKSIKDINLIAFNDPKIDLNLFYIDGLEKNHVEKRKTQRAISHEMIKIAITYGKKEYSHGATRYKLYDRCLFNTPYYKVIDKLRGLCVIAIRQKDNIYAIVTTYWNNHIKRKLTKSYDYYHYRSRNRRSYLY